MTVQELSQLYYLNKEIAMTWGRLEELRIKAENASPVYRAGILDLAAIVSERHQQNLHERNRLERYIAAIADSFTRQIFILRFIEGLEWESVARRVEGNNSGKNVSLIVYRYLKKPMHRSILTPMMTNEDIHARMGGVFKITPNKKVCGRENRH